MKTLTAKRISEKWPKYARFSLSLPLSKGYNPFFEDGETKGMSLSELIIDSELKNVGIEYKPDEILIDEIIISDSSFHIERLVFPVIKGPKGKYMCFISIAGEYTHPRYGDFSTIHPYEYYLQKLAELNDYEWGGIIEDFSEIPHESQFKDGKFFSLPSFFI